MHQAKLGLFRCGHEYVEFYVRPDEDGGWFSLVPAGGGRPRIIIGLGAPDWDDIVAILLHEVYEFLLDRARARFNESGAWSRGSDRHCFFFDHNIFSEVTTLAAHAIVHVLPELSKAHRDAVRRRRAG